jgi:hypothetical protein
MPISETWLNATLKQSAHRDLLRRIVAGDEACSAADFVEVLTEDASFRFGGAPPTVGKAAIARQVAEFFAQIRSMRHDIELAWERDGVLAYEARVTYGTLNGGTLSLPYANVLRLRGTLIEDYRIYIDPTPLLLSATAAA